MAPPTLDVCRVRVQLVNARRRHADSSPARVERAAELLYAMLRGAYPLDVHLCDLDAVDDLPAAAYDVVALLDRLAAPAGDR
jgi:hypothetical protein